VAEAQKQFPDAPAIFIDMEHGLDTDYAETIGVDTKELLLSQPQSGVAALTIVKKMIGLASVIVVDSVPALVTQSELDAEPGDNHVGILPRLMSQHLKEIVPSLGLSDTALVFINQVRMKIGVMFGTPEVSPGGLALKFYTSVRLNVRRSGFIGTKDNRTGQIIKVKAVKNKCAPPFRTAETNIIYGQGLSKWTDILALATEFEIIEKKGAYYYHNDENVAHGQKAGEAWIAKHPEIEKAVREKLFSSADDTEKIQAATTELDETPETIEDLPAESEEALDLFNALAE
jgi:recombination protein RecA